MSRNPVTDPAEYPESPDLALLSAYLDDVLPASDRALVDQRLGVEPVLRTELATLRQTQAILRAAPQLTVPRDFTLDPARFGRHSQLRIVQRHLDRRLRVLGVLGTVAAIAAAIIVVVLNTNLGSLAPTSNTNLIASNPTAVTPSARKVDALAETASAVITPTRLPSSIPSIAPSSVPATVPAITPAAAAVAQSGGISGGQTASGNANQDTIASSPPPNLSAPVVNPSNGAAPNAPQLLMAPSATPNNGHIAPISAPTSLPAEPPNVSRTISFGADLPTVLKIIFLVLIGLFGGKGLGLR